MTQNNFGRRELLIASLTAGFAMAVQPIYAQVIKTETSGLIAGAVKIPVADGEIPAYRAMPAKGGNFPVVLVVQEIFGVHEYIQDVCRRFAKLGYMAIAPQMFARYGDVSKLNNIQEIISKVVSKVPDTQVLSDLDATVVWADNSGKADVDKLGITGFCWGGRIVWLYAAHSPQLKAGVAWYGRLEESRTILQPQYPVDIAPLIKAPVLGLYGGEDTSIPISDVEKMRAALKQTKTATQIKVYPNQPHGFHADYRSSYNEEAAKDGWLLLQNWFKKYGAI
ncbi:dienelactone hydrolase-like enzyme [Rivularia sp. PCC 7116]|uniref:dienelactone hydrolase family protein n=1 Tax=Rivularia sp. PCC 7116 TaxID=373994 RepID=UPI00029ED244|nr:dienelactone hydrolase-like enzyme [Rivularia sp. PCC 7116]